MSLPIHVAHAQGFFQRQGLDVRIRDCPSGRACFELLAEGAADVATAAEVVVTLQSFQREDLAIIATLSASSHQIKLIGRRGAGIAQPAQLRGKRVGTVVGTSAQYFLDTWLLFHEIDPSKATIVPLAPEQTAGALRRHDVDAVAVWEPFASAALTALGDDGLALPNPRVYTQHFNLVTLRPAVTSRRADLVKMLRALMEAQRFIAEQPVKARDILGERLGLAPALAEAQLKEHDYRIRLDQTLVATMSSQARWALREGHVPRTGKRGDALGVIEPALLREVAPAAATVVR